MPQKLFSKTIDQFIPFFVLASQHLSDQDKKIFFDNAIEILEGYANFQWDPKRYVSDIEEDLIQPAKKALEVFRKMAESNLPTDAAMTNADMIMLGVSSFILALPSLEFLRQDIRDHIRRTYYIEGHLAKYEKDRAAYRWNIDKLGTRLLKLRKIHSNLRSDLEKEDLTKRERFDTTMTLWETQRDIAFLEKLMNNTTDESFADERKYLVRRSDV